ncbi:DinB family protein [candidate division KSB1 bacterium]|nr:DinB family protein [candidate division KSB1 bacterium]NIS24932.1 DinB family protein [candidate division KSB1 bacterium]NIT71850.1 DinB family protein [candidate division KSB1 bacterium]NIU25588.1 DinB family protein [candidate division KSB1 bacterium]NIU93159.1 hypothetical protein [candidate division KSB1 bacterium]
MSELKMTQDEILEKYEMAPVRLAELLAALPESALDLAREKNKWTIREIVHHIVDSDSMVTSIIMAGLGNSGCTYDQRWYPTDNSWAKTLAYGQRLIEPALALFHANHRLVEQLICVLPDSWERFVIFRWERDPEGSKITVGNLIHSRVHHAQHHIGQIQETKQVHGL